ncbi:SGNH/GDSL hydrolase family protein [Bradyrhizobium sp. JR3.5]
MDDLMTSPCYIPREFLAHGQELPNFSRAMSGSDTVRIVAVGSSSTEGHGASRRDASYPARLAVGLAARFPDRKFDVVNAGVGGQEAPDEAARFKNDVLSKNPSLVVWQLGTNAAWKDYFLDDVQAAVFRGCDRLRGCKTDLILMDLQYPHGLQELREGSGSTEVCR